MKFKLFHYEKQEANHQRWFSKRWSFISFLSNYNVCEKTQRQNTWKWTIHYVRNETSSSHLWCVFFSGDLRPKPFLFLPSWSGFIWWLVTPRPCSCLLSFLMLPPPSHSILLVTGHHTLVISRYSDPGGSGSPFTGDWAVCAFSWLSAAQSESFSALLSPTPQTWRAFQKSRFFLFVCLEKAHWLRVAILFKILTEIIF